MCIFYAILILYIEYESKEFKSFNEGKDKFPDIRTLDIDGFIVYIGRDAKSNDHLT
jgi:predicted ribosome quality control (RQC) complex YloA/Tae2 family protein